jgi:hypothetical protein
MHHATPSIPVHRKNFPSQGKTANPTPRGLLFYPWLLSPWPEKNCLSWKALNYWQIPFRDLDEFYSLIHQSNFIAPGLHKEAEPICKGDHPSLSSLLPAAVDVPL